MIVLHGESSNEYVCIRHGLGKEVVHVQRGTIQHPNVMGSINMKLTGN